MVDLNSAMDFFRKRDQAFQFPKDRKAALKEMGKQTSLKEREAKITCEDQNRNNALSYLKGKEQDEQRKKDQMEDSARHSEQIALDTESNAIQQESLKLNEERFNFEKERHEDWEKRNQSKSEIYEILMQIDNFPNSTTKDSPREQIETIKDFYDSANSINPSSLAIEEMQCLRETCRKLKQMLAAAAVECTEWNYSNLDIATPGKSYGFFHEEMTFLGSELTEYNLPEDVQKHILDIEKAIYQKYNEINQLLPVKARNAYQNNKTLSNLHRRLVLLCRHYVIAECNSNVRTLLKCDIENVEFRHISKNMIKWDTPLECSESAKLVAEELRAVYKNSMPNIPPSPTILEPLSKQEQNLWEVYRRDVFKYISLILLAKADGVISSSEKDWLQKIGIELHLTSLEIVSFINRTEILSPKDFYGDKTDGYAIIEALSEFIHTKEREIDQKAKDFLALIADLMDISEAKFSSIFNRAGEIYIKNLRDVNRKKILHLFQRIEMPSKAMSCTSCLLLIIGFLLFMYSFWIALIVILTPYLISLVKYRIFFYQSFNPQLREARKLMHDANLEDIVLNLTVTSDFEKVNKLTWSRFLKKKPREIIDYSKNAIFINDLG